MFDLMFVCAIFYFGFWCGKKYGSLKSLYTAARTRVETFFA